jgi:hypothetical protein
LRWRAGWAALDRERPACDLRGALDGPRAIQCHHTQDALRRDGGGRDLDQLLGSRRATCNRTLECDASDHERRGQYQVRERRKPDRQRHDDRRCHGRSPGCITQSQERHERAEHTDDKEVRSQ